MADRGKDNPLKTAIEQTSGLTIVTTRTAFKEPYLKLGKMRGAEDGIAQLNPEILFVAFNPTNTDLGTIGDTMQEVGDRIETSKTEGDKLYYNSPYRIRRNEIVLGTIQISQPLPQLEPVSRDVAITYRTDDPELRELLEQSQKATVGQASIRTEIYIPHRTTEAIFYPSVGLADLSAQLKDYDDTHPGPKPSPYEWTLGSGVYGGLRILTDDEITLFRNGDNHEALKALGDKYLPGYTGPAQRNA